jgi:hypothetical protein
MDNQTLQAVLNGRQKERTINNYKSILGTEAGKHVIYQLIQLSGFFDEKFHGNSKDIFDKGRRVIGTYIYNMVIDSCGFAKLDEMVQQAKRLEDDERKFIKTIKEE